MSSVTQMKEAPKLMNLRVREVTPLISPAQLRREIPLGSVSERTVRESRQEVEAVMEGTDTRPLVILGPCSIHDRKAALEYATRIKKMREELGRAVQKSGTRFLENGMLRSLWLGGVALCG